jgi:hypothetical protein
MFSLSSGHSWSYRILVFRIFLANGGLQKKTLDIYIKQIPLRTYLLRYLVIRAAMGTGRECTSGLQDSLTYMYYTSKRLSMPLLDNYSP